MGKLRGAEPGLRRGIGWSLGWMRVLSGVGEDGSGCTQFSRETLVVY